MISSQFIFHSKEYHVTNFTKDNLIFLPFWKKSHNQQTKYNICYLLTLYIILIHFTLNLIVFSNEIVKHFTSPHFTNNF